jgi:hypothetical protein
VLSLSKKVREQKKGYGEKNIKTKERVEKRWKKERKVGDERGKERVRYIKEQKKKRKTLQNG